MKIRFLAAVVCAVSLSIATAAPAQVVEAGAKFGFNNLTGENGDAFDDALAGGLYMNYNFTPTISLQGSWLYHKHSSSDDAEEALNALTTKHLKMAALTDVRLTVNEFDLNGYFAAPLRWEGARAYLLAGGGITFWKLDHTVIVLTDFERDEEESFWDFAVNIGAGVDYAVTDQFKVGAEVVYSYVFDDFGDGFFNILGTASYGFSMLL